MKKMIFCASAALVLATVGISQAGIFDSPSETSSKCENVSGSWDVREDVKVTCGRDTKRGSTSGTIKLEQTGCSIRFTDQNNAQRSGTVTGKNITYEGIASTDNRGITLTANKATYNGVYDSFFKTIKTRGTTRIEGKTSDGDPIDCTGTTEAKMSKKNGSWW